MTGRNDMNLRLVGQAARDALGAAGIDTMAAELGSPDLQRDLDARQALLGENSCHGSIREHGRLDPRIMRQAGKNSTIAKLFANARLLLAKGCQPSRIQRGSRQHQSGIAAQREAEEAYPGGIDRSSVLPVVQHEIEQANHVGGARYPDGKSVSPGRIVGGIAGMIDRRDDKAGIPQRLCGVVMLAEPTATAVGKDNQRQFCSGEGTIFDAHQAKISDHCQIAERYFFRLAGAGIPDGACQSRRIQQLHARGVGGRSHATEDDGASPKHSAQQDSPLIPNRTGQQR